MFDAETIRALRQQVRELQATIDSQALELIAARSLAADMAGTLTDIGERVTAALKA